MTAPRREWWPCFVCNSLYECRHREVELLHFMRTDPPRELLAAALERKPVAREEARRTEYLVGEE